MKMPVPLHIGLTGGIGTGKSIIAQVFQVLGIPCFNADTAAKQLMQSEPTIITALKAAFGEHIYQGDILQNKALAAIVFNQPDKLQVLNSIVHPATIEYGKRWMAAQHSPYVLKEAAILIESGSYKEMDYIIGVDAPLHIRIARSMQRDRATEEAILARIDKQMDNTEKMKYCDFVIVNDDQQSIIQQVLHIHHTLLQKLDITS